MLCCTFAVVFGNEKWIERRVSVGQTALTGTLYGSTDALPDAI